MLLLADHAEAYIKQEQQNRQREGRHSRPGNFGDVAASRQKAFQ